MPLAHSIWGNNYSSFAYDTYSVGGSESSGAICYSGITHWMYTVGIRYESDMYYLSLSLEVLSALLMSVALVHTRLEEGSFAFSYLLYFLREVLLASTGYRMNYHAGLTIGIFSTLWSTHLIYVVAPISRGVSSTPTYSLIRGLALGGWVGYSGNLDAQSHIHCSSIGSGASLLTFSGGASSLALSLSLSDISHHHLALGILCIWASHSLNSLYKSIGQRVRCIYHAYGSPDILGVAQPLGRSLELELSTSLVLVSQASSFTSQHLYSLSPYVYLSSDYATIVALFSHHLWVASLCMLGGLVHATLFLIRGY